MSTIEELKEANAKLRKEIEEIKTLPVTPVVSDEVLTLVEENEELQIEKAIANTVRLGE